MNIDKLIPKDTFIHAVGSFGSLMNIDKLIQLGKAEINALRFGSLMNIDKLIPESGFKCPPQVLAL